MRALIDTSVATIVAHADELTALDQAIGDGDHGFNMKRGFEAVAAEASAIAAKPLPEALNAIGMQLVMKVGGASGPLYGTLFMAMGKAIGAQPTMAEAAAAFDAAVAAVQARGKAEVGQKTMLDVLVPVRDALAAGGPGLARRLPEVAAAAAEATIPVRATRGRASFLGDRSIGHLDPGARSSSLLIAAVCNALEH